MNPKTLLFGVVVPSFAFFSSHFSQKIVSPKGLGPRLRCPLGHPMLRESAPRLLLSKKPTDQPSKPLKTPNNQKKKLSFSNPTENKKKCSNQKKKLHKKKKKKKTSPSSSRSEVSKFSKDSPGRCSTAAPEKPCNSSGARSVGLLEKFFGFF